MERQCTQNLHTTTVDIQALHAKYKQTREPVPDGQHTKFVYNTQSEKDKFKKMSQDRIQHSSSLKPFSRLPYTYGEFENMEIWKCFFSNNWKYLCDFCTKILLMCLICAGHYQTTYHIRSINNSYIYCVTIIVKLVNSQIHI